MNIPSLPKSVILGHIMICLSGKLFNKNPPVDKAATDFWDEIKTGLQVNTRLG